jgi:hypothetical protein
MEPEAAGQCVRFSFGWGHTAADGVMAAKAVAGVVETLR